LGCFEYNSFLNFLNNFEYHKERSLGFYKPPSKTKGNSLLFHSSKVLPDVRKQIDKYLKRHFSDLYEIYLKRYEEK